MFLASAALGVVAGGLEAFSLLLMIPFLRSLFDMGPLLPDGGRNAAERFIDDVAGGWLGGAEGLEGLRAICLLVLGALLVKNVCLYGARVLSIRVQEFVVRYLTNRNANGTKLGVLEALGPPAQFWSFGRGEIYTGQEPIREVAVFEVSTLFDEQELVEIRTIELARLPVPAAPTEP